MSAVEITRVEDVREGDMVTLTHMGHEFTGKAYRCTRTQGGSLCVGPIPLRWVNSAIEPNRFIRATREVPDLPTEPGSLIVANGRDYGHLFANCVLMRCDDIWLGHGPTGNRICLGVRDLTDPRSEAEITAWVPAKIVTDGEQVTR